MRDEIIKKTDAFVRRELAKMVNYPDNNQRSSDYRIEHSYRVAHLCAEIARAEGFDEERAFVAGLLHDIGYSLEYKTHEDYCNHGRYGADIARPFLTELGYSAAEINEMCYGIAIHCDDRADFENERTLLALTVGDADNIDRFDAFRIYEMLAVEDYRNLPLDGQRAHVEKYLAKLPRLYEMEFSTPTATRMWRENVGRYLDFYKHLKHQIETSYREGDKR